MTGELGCIALKKPGALLSLRIDPIRLALRILEQRHFGELRQEAMLISTSISNKTTDTGNRLLQDCSLLSTCGQEFSGRQAVRYRLQISCIQILNSK